MIYLCYIFSSMKRLILFILVILIPAAWGWGMLRPSTSVTLCLNKPGVHYELPADLDKVAKEIGVHHITYTKEPLPCFTLHKQIKKIISVLDLSAFFKEISASESWDAYYRRRQRRANQHDEQLLIKLDREFVARVICQEGSDCPYPETMGWSLRWISPARIELSTVIGEDFRHEDEARQALRRINQLLKEVVYGAEFPTGYGQKGFYEEQPIWRSVDLREAAHKFLHLLHPRGMSKSEVDAIASMALGGRTILYLPEKCHMDKHMRWSVAQRAQQWVALKGAISIELRPNGCIWWQQLR